LVFSFLILLENLVKIAFRPAPVSKMNFPSTPLIFALMIMCPLLLSSNGICAFVFKENTKNIRKMLVVNIDPFIIKILWF